MLFMDLGGSPRGVCREIVAYSTGGVDSLWETCDELRWQLLDVQGRNIELCSILEAKRCNCSSIEMS